VIRNRDGVCVVKLGGWQELEEGTWVLAKKTGLLRLLRCVWVSWGAGIRVGSRVRRGKQIYGLLLVDILVMEWKAVVQGVAGGAHTPTHSRSSSIR
jgi:hypothetical protein